MTVRGIEAISQYFTPPIVPETLDIPPINIKEEKGRADDSPLSTMTSVERYRLEWEQVLSDLDSNSDMSIRDVAFKGHLQVSKFRSVHWALLLRVLTADHRRWREQREQQRNRYEKLKQEFVKNPHDIAVPDDDPLSQSAQSIWNQYFSDQELFAVIRQDVIRTFPGVDFFRKAKIQNAMSNILFYYAREHPYMCYRQGMHEILAPILFVMYGDHQALLHFMEIAKTEIDETLLDVLNPKFLEADSYSIFSRLMAYIESYYRVTNLVPTQGGYFQMQADANHVISTEVEVMGQLNSIRDKILAKEDLHLHNYLLKLDIPLHIFGIRWLRLLFGREFPLLDLLVLWDAIFADSDRFDLPNYILVAMLIRIRDKLLLSDYTTCLTFLMRYPTNVDINLILQHALHMQYPKKFDRPPNAFVYFTMNSNTNDMLQVNSNNSSPKSSLNATHHKSRKQPATATGLLGHNLQQRERSTSLGDGAKVERQITLLQARNAADSAALARLKVRPETDHIVMDGYSENSPELMRLELKNAQTVITIARNKLQTYLATVRTNVTKNQNSEIVSQALDGIEELCSFLDVKFMFPLHTHAAPIDQALEANEQQQRQTKTLPQRRPETEVESLEKSHDRLSAAIECDGLEELRLGPETVIDNKIAAANNTSVATAYEKPDNGFMFNSARILGNLREIELIPIASDEKIVESHRALPPSSTDNDG